GAFVQCQRAVVVNATTAKSVRNISDKGAFIQCQCAVIENTAATNRVVVTIGNGQGVQHHGRVAGYLKDVRLTVAVDLDAVRQRRGVNGCIAVQPNLAARQQDGLAGKRIGEDDGGG